MNNIDLFYDLRTLYEIPKKSKEVFFELNARISPRRDINNGIEKILLLCPTKQICERTYKKCLVKTNMQRIDERSLLNINENRIYSFMAVDDLLIDRIIGTSFNQIRFIEG